MLKYPICRKEPGTRVIVGHLKRQHETPLVCLLDSRYQRLSGSVPSKSSSHVLPPAPLSFIAKLTVISSVLNLQRPLQQRMVHIETATLLLTTLALLLSPLDASHSHRNKLRANGRDHRQISSTVVPAHKRSSPALLPGWSYVGCMADPSATRLLPVQVVSSTAAAMTQQKCVALCNAASYVYAGVEVRLFLFLRVSATSDELVKSVLGRVL